MVSWEMPQVMGLRNMATKNSSTANATPTMITASPWHIAYAQVWSGPIGPAGLSEERRVHESGIGATGDAILNP